MHVAGMHRGDPDQPVEQQLIDIGYRYARVGMAFGFLSRVPLAAGATGQSGL